MICSTRGFLSMVVLRLDRRIHSQTCPAFGGQTNLCPPGPNPRQGQAEPKNQPPTPPRPLNDSSRPFFHLPLNQNSFPGKTRILWALYDARPSPTRGKVLAVPHPEGATCRDEWTGKEKYQASARFRPQSGQPRASVLQIHIRALTGHAPAIK